MLLTCAFDMPHTADLHLLLSTSGAEWKCQQDEEMEKEMAQKVKKHSDDWSKKGQQAKSHSFLGLWKSWDREITLVNGAT